MPQYYRLWTVHRDLVQHRFYWIINKLSLSFIFQSPIPFNTVSRGKEPRALNLQQCILPAWLFSALGVFWRDFLEPNSVPAFAVGFSKLPQLSFLQVGLEHGSPMQDAVWTFIIKYHQMQGLVPISGMSSTIFHRPHLMKRSRLNWSCSCWSCRPAEHPNIFKYYVAQNMNEHGQPLLQSFLIDVLLISVSLHVAYPF